MALENEIHIEKIEYISQLKNIIKEFDNTFEPNLTERVGNLEKYALKLYTNAVNIMAVYNNRVVGFASFYCNDVDTSIAYLTQIAVLQDFREKRVGQILLDKVIKISNLKGMNYLKLEVYNENVIAQKFYKKNGFKEIGKSSSNSKYMIRALVGE